MYDDWIFEPPNQKPQMKTITNLLNAPVPSIISAKADGEFSLVRFKEDKIASENVWKRVRTDKDLVALWQLRDALMNNTVESATFKAELYYEEDGRPQQLPHFNSNKDSPNLRLGLFDLIEYNGSLQDRIPYKSRLVTMENIIISDYYKRYPHRCSYTVLPYYEVQSIEVLGNHYRQFIKEGYEGAVITDKDNHIFKLKPLNEIDAVIVGINVKGKLRHGEVTSVKVALIGDKGNFIDLTDVASGIEVDLRKELYKLMDYQTQGTYPTNETIRVQPLVVVTVGYQETYPDVSKPTYYYNSTQHRYERLPETNLVSLRSPRLMRFRPDKTINAKDVGLNQLPIE